MTHHDDENDTYFLDQICLVALSGAFGAICLSMYFIKQEMLYLLLGTQFHLFVLGSGIALLLLAIVRASVLWSMAGTIKSGSTNDWLNNNGLNQADAPHDHDHGHGDDGHEHSHSHEHPHAHSHGDCGHDHAPSHAEIAQSHAFGHTPNPSHAHSHGADHADHDHGWAPWRYVLLLVPIILFLLGLPNKGPAINDRELVKVDTTHEEIVFGSMLTAVSCDAWSSLAAAGRYADAGASEAEFVNVKRLEDMAGDPKDREYYKGKMIRVRGQYWPHTDRQFSLVRFRRQCCAADAIQVSVAVVARESITHVKAPSWVEVTGRVDFRGDKGAYKTLVLAGRRDEVRACNPDLNPYLD